MILFMSCSSSNQMEQPASFFSEISFDFDRFIADSSFLTRDSLSEVNYDFIKSCRKNRSSFSISYDCEDILFPVHISISKLDKKYFYLIQRNQRLLFRINEDGSVDLGLDNPLKKIITKEVVSNLVRRKFKTKKFSEKNLGWSEHGFYNVIIKDNGDLELFTTDLENKKFSNKKISNLIWTKDSIIIGREDDD